MPVGRDEEAKARIWAEVVVKLVRSLPSLYIALTYTS